MTQFVIDLLEREGKPARFIGGCVRDSLLWPGLNKIDIDITTVERPEVVMARFDDAGIKVIPTGLAHGTVTAVLEDRQFEITTLRKDVATDGRHAQVAFTADFDLDASRRDFTINALRCDRQGAVTDPFTGIEDLQKGLVRFIGDPKRRITEDYLRILRFFRFFARFGRQPVDEVSLQACKHHAAGLDRIAGERIQMEVSRLLIAPGAIEACGLMVEAGVAQTIGLPANGLQAGGLSAMERLAEVEHSSDWRRRLAIWLRAAKASDTLDTLSGRWRLANDDRDRLATLLRSDLPRVGDDEAVHRRTIYRLGPALYRDLLLIGVALDGGAPSRLEILRKVSETWTPPKFPLNGEDLISQGMAPGPELGRALKELETWWLERDFQPDREALLGQLQARLS